MRCKRNSCPHSTNSTIHHQTSKCQSNQRDLPAAAAPYNNFGALVDCVYLFELQVSSRSHFAFCSIVCIEAYVAALDIFLFMFFPLLVFCLFVGVVSRLCLPQCVFMGVSSFLSLGECSTGVAGPLTIALSVLCALLRQYCRAIVIQKLLLFLLFWFFLSVCWLLYAF